MCITIWVNGYLQLLQSGYDIKSFGDTHSLVLLVDSLNVQSTLLNLVPIEDGRRDKAASLVRDVLSAASNLRATAGDLFFGGQGAAEGDVLENVVNALAAIFLGKDRSRQLLGSPSGGTWAKLDFAGEKNDPGYTGRNKFYEVLTAVTNSAPYQTLLGKMRLSGPETTGSDARKDFGALLSVVYLTPFALSIGADKALAQLQAINPDLAEKFNKDLQLGSKELLRGDAYISNEYLSTRADLAKRKLYYSIKNARYDKTAGVENVADTGAADYDQEDIVWTDRASKLVIKRDADTTFAKYVVFGSDMDEADIKGGNRNDSLFGGGGADIIDGGAGDDHLEGNDGADVLSGGVGKDKLLGGSGDDKLDGGAGNDLLNAGEGNDTYVFSGDYGNDTIYDLGGMGHIQIDGVTIGKGVGNGKRDQWRFEMGGGVSATLSLLDDPESSTGKKLVIAKGDEGKNSVTIGNFDLARAQAGGYLGVQLDGTVKAAIKVGGGANLWQQAGFDPGSLAGASVDMVEGTGRTFTVFLNQAAKAGQTVTLNVGGAGGTLKAILGDITVPASGAVIPLVEGQTQVSFALIQDGALGADTSATVKALVSGKEGIITSNSFNVVLKDSGDFKFAFKGDQSPALGSPDGSYNWSTSKWQPDGTLTNAVAHKDFFDVIYGSNAADKMFGFGGNDALSGADGADNIDGGAGDDLITGGAGSDYLLGGDGNDFIASASRLSVALRSKEQDGFTPPEGAKSFAAGAGWGIYATQENEAVNMKIWAGVDYSVSSDPDYVDGGAGNDGIVGSDGADHILGGTGNDEIDGRAGDDVLEGNDGDDFIDGDGTTSPGFLESVPAPMHGNDFIDGGAGKDRLEGCGGSDVVFGGIGNDNIWGDSAGKTDDKGYAGLQYHGDDYLDGEDGNDYMEGGGKNDTLYGGSGDDGMWGDTSAENLASPADNALMWGDDYLDGEEGNDSMLGGGGDDILFGGTGNDNICGDSSGSTASAGHVKVEFQGNDYLDGEDGDDLLIGGAKNDTVYGGTGNDKLWGDLKAADAAGEGAAVWGNDYLAGEDGDDYAEGGGGDDTLIGGTGKDTLFGDERSTALDGAFQGDDMIDGGAGDDELIGGGGKDSLIGGAGDDILLGDDEAATLAVAFNGSDFLDGGDGNDRLGGGGGDDVLLGGAGNDVLDGGTGADVLDGGEGNDVYNVDNVGDIIRETAPSAPATAGKQPSTAGGLGQQGGALMLTSGSSAIVAEGTSVDTVSSSISYQLGDNLENLTLTGKEAVDGTGNELGNYILGNSGSNTLGGAGGIDVLNGGAGNDVYIFNRGDGSDTIENSDLLRDTANLATAQAVDTLRFGADIEDADIIVSRSMNSLVLSVRESDDKVYIKDYFAAETVAGTLVSDFKVDRIEFANGVVWNPAKIDALLLRQANNQAPVAGPGVPFLSARAGDPFSYTLAAANLTDPDADDKLHYSIELEGKLPAPAWVKFDAATRTVSGVPDDASVGKLVLIVVAKDNYGAGAGIGIVMNIGAANRKPVLNSVPVDAKASRGTPLTYNVPANLFTDLDGDALTYSVTLDKGGSLPSWLSFNPKTGVLSGTPSTLDHLVLAITATDVHGLSAQTLMKLDVDNRAPTFGAWTQVPGGAANDVWQFTVPQGSFTDSDPGDTLSYAATSPDGSALPAWLKFDAATRTFSGRPPAVGKYDVLVKASDLNGASVSAVLPITIDPNQVYSGTDAVDVKEGGWGHDSLKGLGGNDTLLGSFGNDRLDGGAGNDLLKGGGGADTYVFGKGYGNDTIDNQDLPLQAGIDTIEFLPGVAVGDVKPTRADNDLLLSLPASGDSLRVLNYFKADELALSQVEFIKFADGTSWALAQILPFLLVGSAGNDKLYGSDTNDMLDGGAGNDRLDAGAGNDTLAGGTGSDDLIGGAGADTYRFNKGDGKDTISDVSPAITVPDVDRLEFGPGLMPADVEAVRDGATLRLNFGNSGDAVTIWSYFSTRTDLNLAVEQIAFADGTLWTMPMVMQQVLKGTDLDDKLEGTAGNDVISGRKGQDSLLGLQGNDTLSGGAGNDTLDGGVGDDVLDGGAGRDRMVGGAGNDIFKFGHGDGPDFIVTSDTAAGKVDTIRFADDVLVSDVLVERWKNKLVLTLQSSKDTLFVEDYFLETNGVRTGKIEQLQFADGTSWSSVDIDKMAAPHTNIRPFISDMPFDMNGNVNSTFSIILPTNRIVDADYFDVLAFSVDPVPGYPVMPSWLKFDPLTMRLWGTPGANDQGMVGFYLFGTDLYGETAAIQFFINVGPVSVAPILNSPISDLVTSQGTPFRLTLGDVFTDTDKGDVVAYSATLSTGAVLPTWLTFDPVAREFSGMSAAAGTLSVRVTGTDLGGKTASDVFDIVVAPDSVITGTAGNDTLKGGAGNDIIRGLGGNDELESGLGRDTLEGGAGDDAYLINHDDDTVVENGNEGIDTVRTALPKYTLPANVDNLVFNGEVAGILTGNNLNNQLSAGAGAQTLDGGTGADTMAGGAGDDRYVVDSVLDNVVELPDGGNDTITSSLSFTLPVNVESLELIGTENIDATGNAGNNKIRGNAGNNRLEGGGGRDYFYGGGGDDTYVVDSGDDLVFEDSGNDTIETSISSPNVLFGGIENLTLTGAALSRFGNALNNIIKGNALNNTLDGLEGNDQLLGAGGDDTLSGGAGNDVYVVERGDGKDVILNDDVTSAVDTLRFGKDIAEGDIWAQRSGENLLLLLHGTTDQVTFSKYFAADVTKDGAIVNNKIERVEFAGGVVWDQAKIQSLVDISSANKVPVRGPVSVAPFKAEVGKPLSFVLAANTLVDPDPLDTFVYSASLANDVPLPAWLKFDVASRTFSGTPTVADVGSVPVKLWGTDNRGGRGYIDLPLVVSPANRTPVLAAALADQSNALGTAFSYVVPAGAFTDPDAGTVLSYSATMADGTALPAWLSFNATTRAFGGTPPAAGTFSVKVSARDSGNLSTSDVFDLVVSVKNLTLTGTAGADQLNGGAGNDILNGLDGNDKLNGGGGNDTMDGGLGTDTMTGGAGDDVYVFDLAADVAVEAANEGNDTVKSSVSTVLGNNIEALTLTGTAPVNATGNALNNVLTGNSGDNTLDGGGGADILNGGSGNDLYIVDNVGDIVNEGNYVGVDTVQTGLNYELGPYLDNLTLTGSLAVDGKGNAGNNVIKGNANNNVLDGGTGADAISGGAGNDTYIVDNAGDTVVELANEGIDTVKSGVSSTLSANIEALFLTGVNGISGTGNALNNLLVGNGANNVLNGDAGDDLLQGGAGLDTLTDTLGNNLLDGGAGNDTLTAGVGREMLIGGVGNDVIVTGDGADIIAFNRGDGQDVVNASTGKDNTVSLGKGVLYADLLFKKTANDLVLVTGAAEQITFKDWYAAPANRSVANLQVVIEGGSDYDAASASKLNNKKVEQFNFDGLAGAFDAARTANPALTSWALSSSLLNFYLSGSDTAALGGDLAYQYARTGNLSSMSMLPAGALLSSPAFGVTAQPLQAGSALRDLSPQLV